MCCCLKCVLCNVMETVSVDFTGLRTQQNVCDNYVHIHHQTQKKLYLIATFRSPTANFIRHVVM